MQDKKNRTKLNITTDDKLQASLEKGTYDIIVDGVLMMQDVSLKTGAVYAIPLYEDNGGNFVSTRSE